MRRLILVLAASALLSACAEDRNTSTQDGGSDTTHVQAEDSLAIHAENGNLVYIPVYSHIYYRDRQRAFNLTATMSVRNTDPRTGIRLHKVDYYDSDGRLVRSYISSPVDLPPLGSRAYVVEEEDVTGGVGANFLVEWSSRSPVIEPIMEAVMISTASKQGISFVTRGKRLEIE